MNTPSSVILSIGTAHPKNRFTREEVLEYMVAKYDDSTAGRKLSILARQSGIRFRNSVLPDFNLQCQVPELFLNGNQPSVDQRMDIYKRNALSLAIEATDNALDSTGKKLKADQITHIITVSCTGLYSPGLSSELADYYKLPVSTFHTAINFMGCNAAFPALRMADLIVRADEKAVVLVVAVELCTIHFIPKDNDDNLLANSLFADGAAAALVTSPSESKAFDIPKYGIHSFASLTLNEGKPLMAWDIKSMNFEMVLSPNIPAFLGSNLTRIKEELKKAFNTDISHTRWAVHPGGKKILDTFVSESELHTEDLMESYKILEENGNMSSVTILFILQRILINEAPAEKLTAIGFGPGISIEAALLEKIPG